VRAGIERRARDDPQERRADDAVDDRTLHAAHEQRGGDEQTDSATSTGGAVKDPNVTNVAGFATTAPALRRPKNARNIPMPAVTANLSGFGIARTIA